MYHYSATTDLLLAQIECEYNPRSQADEAGLNELADSITGVGVINPITVYLKAPGVYGLIAGSRRYKASQIAKLQTIPARVLENPTDEAIRNLKIIENCQRQDIHPMDEARAFKATGLPAEELGAQIGKSARYVYDRLHLLRLSAYCEDLYTKGHLTLSHALLLCRLTTTEQDRVVEEVLITNAGEILGASHIQKLRIIVEGRASTLLSNAVFNTADGKLAPEVGSCTNCQQRSGYNTTLFHDVQGVDKCFDTTCYDTKNALQCALKELELQEQGYEVVRLSGAYQPNPLDEAYNLVSDFGYVVKDFDGAPGQTVGLFYRHRNRAKVGTVVLLEKADGKPEPKRKNPEVQNQRAARAFATALLNVLGERIGAIADGLPTPVSLMLAEEAFLQLPNQQQAEVAKFYKWGFTPGQRSADQRKFREATVGFSGQDAVHLLLVLAVYGTLKGTLPGSPGYYYIDLLCKEWRIDVLALCSSVEQQFGVNLQVLRGLFNE